MSKTMPVIPRDFNGLNTTLSDVWIEADITVVDDESDDGWSTSKIVVVSAIVAGCLICIMCLWWHCPRYIAQRKIDKKNRIKNEEHIKEASNRSKVKKEPKN